MVKYPQRKTWYHSIKKFNCILYQYYPIQKTLLLHYCQMYVITNFLIRKVNTRQIKLMFFVEIKNKRKTVDRHYNIGKRFFSFYLSFSQMYKQFFFVFYIYLGILFYSSRVFSCKNTEFLNYSLELRLVVITLNLK